MNTEIIREEFTAWMRREMPANTIISDPDWWARKILGTIGALDAKAEQQAFAWTPTAENINGLPDPIRRYIHGLHANCDPAGMVAENTSPPETRAK